MGGNGTAVAGRAPSSGTGGSGRPTPAPKMCARRAFQVGDVQSARSRGGLEHVQLPGQPPELVVDVRHAAGGAVGPSDQHHVGTRTPDEVSCSLPQQPLRPVAHDRATDPTRCDDSHPRCAIGPRDYGVHDGEAPSTLSPTAQDSSDRSPVRQPLVARRSHGRHAVSLARPRRRRLLTMARPALVRMRERNPCLRARRRLLGWKVRFTLRPPDGSSGHAASVERNPRTPCRMHTQGPRAGGRCAGSYQRTRPAALDQPGDRSGSDPVTRRTAHRSARGVLAPTRTQPGCPFAASSRAVAANLWKSVAAIGRRRVRSPAAGPSPPRPVQARSRPGHLHYPHVWTALWTPCRGAIVPSGVRTACCVAYGLSHRRGAPAGRWRW
jgi:hypothetical protein